MPNIYAVSIPIPIDIEAGFAVDGDGQIIYIQAWEPQHLYNMLGYLVTAMIFRQQVVGEQYMNLDPEDTDWLTPPEQLSLEDQETAPSILLPPGVDMSGTPGSPTSTST